MSVPASSSPQFLYKYRSFSSACDFERTQRIVCDSHIYFAPPCSFNDPFDCRPAFSFDAPVDEMKAYYRRLCGKRMPHLTELEVEAEIERLFAEPGSDMCAPQGQQKIQELHSQALGQELGVLCLSSQRDHILMWSHYADCHRGICLEFDTRASFLAGARPIGYEDSRLLINPFRDRDEEMAEKTFLMKASHWHYEGEWRLIRYDGPGEVAFEPQALTGIVLGALTPPEAERQLREWVARRQTPVKLSRAYPDQQAFRLHVRPVPDC